MSYIYIVCFTLILFFSFSLISKAKKTLSEKIFVGWIFLLAITELSFFINALGMAGDYSLLFSLVCDSHVLHGGFYYFYVQSFTDKQFRMKGIHVFHLLPFALMFGLKYYFNEVLGVMDCYGVGCIHAGNRYIDLLTFLKFGILGAYLFAGWHLVHDRVHHNRGEDRLEKIRSNWIDNITVGIFIIYSFSASYKVLDRLEFNFLGSAINAINIMVTFFILIFLYMGNSYAYIFVSPYQGKGIDLDAVSKNKDEQANEMAEEEPVKVDVVDLDRKFNLIEAYLKREKPYLKGQMTIRQLSDNIGIPQNEISYIIQQKTDKYYCDYMNAFRVEALKEKLDSPKLNEFTVLSLGLECGFASKTSLNRIFKQHTSVTPSEYRSNKNA
ncbi:helix-turn-helix domain-containing protein [Saccharicrinis sp. GN24d3]|uniref:helix-turn-helix domain-containing protein n=1 Tax=Saccharicrinis sp. GN24d3 TaxID=3458416 RepID=UPI004035B3F5